MKSFRRREIFRFSSVFFTVGGRSIGAAAGMGVDIIMMDKKDLLSHPEYGFLKQDRLKISYLSLSGSYAYGTNVETSDIDIRGFGFGSAEDVVLGKETEQIENKATDTVVFGLRKFVSLLRNCNPNSIELLGTREEDVLLCDEFGKRLRESAELFLSKKAFKTFAGYATAQLRRLQNALAHDSYPQAEKEMHIKKTLDVMMMTAAPHYELNGGEFSFSVNDENELVVSASVKDMPLRKFVAINNDLNTTLRNYDKLNHRNSKKDEAHLRKHAMHLVRLYLTGLDILRGNGIVTYREKDLPLLRKIRAGEVPFGDVFAMAQEFEREMKDAEKTSKLPDKPRDKEIDALVYGMYKDYFGMK